MGAYLSTFATCVPTYLYATLLSGQYVIPNIYCEVKAAYTNTVPVDAYRGAGRPEASYVVERLMEKAARELGVRAAVGDGHAPLAVDVEVVGGAVEVPDGDARRAAADL